MSDYAERIALGEKVALAVKMATTYLRKSSDALYWTTQDRTTRVRPLPSEYWTLLDRALETAADIVEELPDDFFLSGEVEDYFGLGDMLVDGKFNSSDEPLELARKVVAAIEARRERGNVLRRIKALESTEGRTEAEAEAFRAKASELRRSHGIEVPS